MPECDGEPREMAQCWRLLKTGRGEAACSVWSHPLGRELRLALNGELLRSEVFRGARDGKVSGYAWADRSVEWLRAFQAKGWTEPPTV